MIAAFFQQRAGRKGFFDVPVKITDSEVEIDEKQNPCSFFQFGDFI